MPDDDVNLNDKLDLKGQLISNIMSNQDNQDGSQSQSHRKSREMVVSDACARDLASENRQARKLRVGRDGKFNSQGLPRPYLFLTVPRWLVGLPFVAVGRSRRFESSKLASKISSDPLWTAGSENQCCAYGFRRKRGVDWGLRMAWRSES